MLRKRFGYATIAFFIVSIFRHVLPVRSNADIFSYEIMLCGAALLIRISKAILLFLSKISLR